MTNTPIKNHAEVQALSTGLTENTFSAKTKINRALTDAPDFVVFREIGTIANGFQPQRWTVAELLEELADGKTLTVVGPDPYTDRRYFGTVKVVKNKLVVR